MINKHKAIMSLRPDSSWSWIGENYSDLNWLDPLQNKPTEDEIIAEVIKLQQEYDLTQYQRKRAKEYPPLTDLADAMYWSSQGDNTKLDAYYAACEAVKLKYPKVNNE